MPSSSAEPDTVSAGGSPAFEDAKVTPREFGRGSQLIIGLVWFVFPAFVASDLTGHAFWAVYGALLALIVSCSGLVAFWMAAWARRADNRFGRFRIASLLLTMLLIGVFCGVVRWLAIAAESRFTPAAGVREPAFVGVAAVVALFLAISTPIIIGLLDSLIWIAVGLLKWPALRRMVSRVRHRG